MTTFPSKPSVATGGPVQSKNPATAGLLLPGEFARSVNRRRFLGLLGAATAAGIAGCSKSDVPAVERATTSPDRTDPARVPLDDSLPVPSSSPAPEHRSPMDPTRRLVVIEMSGGNDGLAMLQPFESSVLQDRRGGLVSEDAELIDAGGGFGWHPNLAGIADVGVAAAIGIGSREPDFSHFEMEQRWWSGVSRDQARTTTGFFGRLCDQLDIGDPVTGLSLAGGPTPGLAAERAVTAGLADPGASWFFHQDEPWYAMLRSTLGAMGEASDGDSDRFSAARSGLTDTLRFAEALAEIPERDDDIYPYTELGQQLRFAAEVISLDVGVRVMHVSQGGYDTHRGQQWRHGELMTELNDALVAFTSDLQARGLFEETLIMTTSEFGRRVDENDQGTDHGGASAMMVCGPGTSGVHGEAPNLNRLDDGNVVATARFEDYYATVANDWFGIGPELVLPDGGTPIAGLI